MKRSKFTEQQIFGILKKAEAGAVAGRAREEDYAAIRKQLEDSGRFGKIAAGLLDRMEKRPR